MSRELAGLEHFNDAHGRAAARARIGRSRIRSGVLGLGRRRSDIEQLAREREVVGLHTACQKTVVANAVKALGQHCKAEIEKWWPIIKAAGIKAE